MIGAGAAVLVPAVAAYLVMGNVIYSKLANVKGSCDEHLANRPDRFALHGSRPDQNDVVAYSPDGSPYLRYTTSAPVIGATGRVEEMALYAGQDRLAG